MKKNKEILEKNARRLIDFMLDSSAHELVYNGIFRKNKGFLKSDTTKFLQDFIPVKLALGCMFWNQCCEVHGLEAKEIKNLYFLEVMKRFETPQSVDVATRFSECLYAVNARPEESPVLSATSHLFGKLGLKCAEGEEGTAAISEAFLFAMEVNEALKNAFENEFDDLFYANESFYVPESEQKGRL